MEGLIALFVVAAICAGIATAARNIVAHRLAKIITREKYYNSLREEFETRYQEKADELVSRYSGAQKEAVKCFR